MVTSGGSKRWRFKYRYDGKEKLLAIGVYPDISLAEARGRRQEARSLVANGVDPSAEKKAAKQKRADLKANSFEAIAREWHEHMVEKKEWSEIDFDAAEWNIPGQKMKMKEPHLVPLSKQAIAILKEIQPLTGNSKYVFPSTRSFARCMSDNTINASFRRMGFDGVNGNRKLTHFSGSSEIEN